MSPGTYRLEVRYTSRLHDLRSTDALWDGLRDNVRREIRKARKRVEVVDNLGVEQFHSVLSMTYARQRIPTPHSLAELERLESACASREAGAMLFARDDAGRVHAVAWVVWDQRGAYYLLAGEEEAEGDDGEPEAGGRGHRERGAVDLHVHSAPCARRLPRMSRSRPASRSARVRGAR